MHGGIFGSRGGGVSLSGAYCGYAGAPECLQYSGATKIQIDPVPGGDLTMRADTVVVPPGGYMVEFRTGVTPSGVGIEFPYRMRAWQWASADGTDSSQTRPCYWSNKVCRTPIYDSGTMTAIALVNGVERWQSISVTVGSPKLTVSASRSAVRPTYPARGIKDPVTVTARFMNGTAPIANKEITFTATAVEKMAGHEQKHSGPKPPGGFASRSVLTDKEGIATTEFTPSEISGPVWIVGSTSDAKRDSVKVDVGLTGLTTYAARGLGYYRITKGTHPQNFFVHDEHASRLLDLAQQFAEHTEGDSIGFNDSSLPEGGQFDIYAQWSSPHKSHRLGRSTDIRTFDQTDEDLKLIARVWRDLNAEPRSSGRSYIKDERKPAPPGESSGGHFHLESRP
jgi:hypothetical protein